MFWNISDNALNNWLKDKNKKYTKLNKYVDSSQPKIGWDNQANINHFELVKFLFDSEILLNKEEIATFFDISSLEKSVNLVQSSTFSSLLVNYRLELIIECLTLRFQKLRSITHD